MWGQTGLVKHQRLSNSSTPWGGGGIPMTIPIFQSGILFGLRHMLSGTPAFTPGTGTIAVDKQGPFNIYTWHSMSPNNGSPLFSVSGYGLYLINLIRKAERGIGAWDVAAISEENAGALADVFSAAATSGTATWRFSQDLPITQRISGMGDIGGIMLQNPAVQFNYQPTPNSATASSPFNIYSTTAGAAPYLVTGNATVTLASPTIDLVRDMYEVPANPQDMPYAGWKQIFVPTWIEESPQGVNVNGATTYAWKATPVAGLLARLLLYVFDGGTSQGIATSSLTNANALVLSYNNASPIQSESGAERLAQQFGQLGYALPQGAFLYDFLGGRDLSMTDVLDTQLVANIQLTVNQNVALGATNSAVKVIKEVLLPVQVG